VTGILNPVSSAIVIESLSLLSPDFILIVDTVLISKITPIISIVEFGGNYLIISIVVNENPLL